MKKILVVVLLIMLLIQSQAYAIKHEETSWSYRSIISDEEAKLMVKELGNASLLGGGGAGIAGAALTGIALTVFAPAIACVAFSSIYVGMLSNSINYYNKGKGVIVDIIKYVFTFSVSSR